MCKREYQGVRYEYVLIEIYLLCVSECECIRQNSGE